MPLRHHAGSECIAHTGPGASSGLAATPRPKIRRKAVRYQQQTKHKGAGVQYRSFSGRTEVEELGVGGPDGGASAEQGSDDSGGAETDLQRLMRRLGMGGQPAWFNDRGEAATSPVRAGMRH